MNGEPHQLSVWELRTEIRRGTLSPVEVVEAYLDRIRARNDELNAYITVLEEDAVERAGEAEDALKSGDEVGPLHGVPVAVKDLLGYKAGVRHTFGAKPLEDFVPDRDAIFVERLEDAGAIVIGKTNTPEFGFKGTTDNRLLGATGTPFDSSKTAGGSSGGSATAVAAGLAPVAQGSDVGGSIRIPASCCGVYGFYPSHGRVPHAYRPNAFVSQTPFNSIGPIARTVRDAALLLDVMSGPDRRDPFSLPDDETAFLSAMHQPIPDTKIAYSPDLDVFPIDDRVSEIVSDAVETFTEADAEVESVDLGLDLTFDELVDTHIRLKRPYWAELRAHVEREHDIDLLDHRADLPDELLDLVESGQEMSASEYKLANVKRTEFYDAVRGVFDSHDILVAPTLGTPPFGKDKPGPSEIDGREIDPSIGWFLTFPFNMIGYPVASIPAGFTDDGLPVGMQIVGPQHGDEAVLATSATFEYLNPWADQYPFSVSSDRSGYRR
ncbi:amidase [Halorussus salinisoli]|uniref:amidase n=1 Tax=Halorussus salinisoli TaxID=2558242 RepID=UPI0010C2282F|nr:amidase [Halorussus salinisoli]